VEQPPSFFRGSELPRLLFLAAIMVVGWVVVWQYATRMNNAAEPDLTVAGDPEPVVPDKSIEFETVTDRTPLGFRDNAAYALLLERARGRNANELATVARRDIMLPHLWEKPALYRGVPIHLLGAALKVLRYPSKLSPKGWLYEAWIMTDDQARVPFVCVFEDVPEGFPIGANLSERVVFNGYFLKIMKYEAGDTTRGAPVLVGRIGWTPSASATKGNDNSTLRRTLIILGVLFFASMIRWVLQLRRFLNPRPQTSLRDELPVNEEIDPPGLDEWLRSVGPEKSQAASHEGEDAG
jgi:hypothetical protein